MTLRPTILAVLFLSAAARLLAGDNYLVYFGTATTPKSGSKGIYVSTFNAATGKLGDAKLAAEAGSPGFLAIHPSKKYLFAIGEIKKEDGKKGGGLAAYSISLPSGMLTRINESSAIGEGPCHVGLDETAHMAMIANYGSGSIASYSIKEDGSLSDAVTFIQHEGSSIDPRRQAGPHAHSVNRSPDNRFAFACDLGLDKVFIYKIDPATGKMTPNDPAFATVPPGSGPRHLAFHPSGKFVFVNNEMAMTVTFFAYDASKGSLTAIETISTLPPEDQGKQGFSTAETVAHPNGKIVYVSNRTHDTIAVFACDPTTGKLKLIQNAPCEGQIPRNFNLDPSGKWMIVGHQNSNTAALFKVDPDTGMLTFTGTKIEVGGPICVRFLALD